MIIKIIKSKLAFTLMELLIIIALIALIAAAALFLLNPWAQINKGQDSKRKQELTQLNKVFEDYYNDKQCYPPPSQICYNAGAGTTCNICGNEPTSPSFSPYLSRLPCDPRQPAKKYLYQVDSTGCPTWYRIYTTLSNTADPVIVSVGCQNGCGLAPDFSYNYGVASPNIGLQANTNLCSSFGSLYVIVASFCNICGSYNNCQINFPGQTYYTDPGGGGIPGCTIPCIKD